MGTSTTVFRKQTHEAHDHSLGKLAFVNEVGGRNTITHVLADELLGSKEQTKYHNLNILGPMTQDLGLVNQAAGQRHKKKVLENII